VRCNRKCCQSRRAREGARVRRVLAIGLPRAYGKFCACSQPPYNTGFAQKQKRVTGPYLTLPDSPLRKLSRDYEASMRTHRLLRAIPKIEIMLIAGIGIKKNDCSFNRAMLPSCSKKVVLGYILVNKKILALFFLLAKEILESLIVETFVKIQKR